MPFKLIIFGLFLFTNGFLVNSECPKPYSHCNLGKEVNEIIN